MADVCGGLHAAHELHGADGRPLGVVHRDVSPQNILVSTKGIAKLIDFGVAKARNTAASREDTNTSQLKGKVRYMAPEHALGHEMDRRADRWAVGAVLYHLLSGRAPFEGENEANTLFLLTSGRPPTPMRGTVHSAVAAVVRRALSHEPDLRASRPRRLMQGGPRRRDQAGRPRDDDVGGRHLPRVGGGRSRGEAQGSRSRSSCSAAEARERYSEIMRANTEKSHGGTSATGARVIAEKLTAAGGPDRVGRARRCRTAAASTSASSPASGETLGSAAVVVAARDGTRGRRLAVVGCVLAAAICVLALGALRGRGNKASAATATPPMPIAAATVPPQEPVAAATSAPAPTTPRPHGHGHDDGRDRDARRRGGRHDRRLPRPRRPRSSGAPRPLPPVSPAPPSREANLAPRLPEAARDGDHPGSPRLDRARSHADAPLLHRRSRGSKMAFSRARTAALILASLLASASAHADPSAADRETARTLMQQGRELRAKGRSERRPEALPGGRRDHARPLDRAFEVIRSQIAIGQLVEARDTIAAIRRIAPKPTDPAPFKEARCEGGGARYSR